MPFEILAFIEIDDFYFDFLVNRGVPFVLNVGYAAEFLLVNNEFHLLCGFFVVLEAFSMLGLILLHHDKNLFFATYFDKSATQQAHAL